jgi:hypothetical protein
MGEGAEMMKVNARIARGVVAGTAAVALGACSQLGGVLGGILPSSGTQVTATIRSVDTRAQVISLQQSNGQTLGVNYDNNTKVVYQNQIYQVTSLEFGDQVLARVIDQGNNVYYTDSVYVTQPVNGSNTGTGSANVQSLQGTVRQVNVTNGWFTLDIGNSNTLTVAMPYRPSSTDINKFQNLRVGDFVRLYGVFLNSTRVELQRFY